MRFIKLILFIVSIIFLNRCDKEIDPVYKQYMREFVQDLSSYAKGLNGNFIIIPQNGQELVTEDGNEDGTVDVSYLSAIDGVGREDLFYDYRNDNRSTPDDEMEYMVKYLDICEDHGVEVLTTDYCWDHDKMNDSYNKNNAKGFISFAAPERELNQVPDFPAEPYNVNNSNINNLSDAKNFLYLINPEKYSSKQLFINAMQETNYDLIIMDLFLEEDEFTMEEINQLKTKKNGGKRLAVCYMSIGEAEDYRYYWQNSWKVGSPEWIKKENPDWEGNYKVEYWEKGWQDIIFGNETSYLKKIIDSGFDGVYLDIIDAFEYFE